MRFNKTIREYLEKELDKKIETAKSNDPVYIDYKDRQEKAIEELEKLIADFYPQVNAVLQKYCMSLMYQNWSGTPTDITMAEKIFPFYSGEVLNFAIRSALQDKSMALRKKKAEYMEQIELECSLGADKDAFMKMIADTKF